MWVVAGSALQTAARIRGLIFEQRKPRRFANYGNAHAGTLDWCLQTAVACGEGRTVREIDRMIIGQAAPSRIANVGYGSDRANSAQDVRVIERRTCDRAVVTAQTKQ